MRFLYLICLLFLCSFTLGDRLSEAKKGEFFVTEQEKNYSLLFVRERSDNYILFEEVAVPCHDISLKTQDWKQWMEQGAPGHTSWIQYEIEKSTLTLVECYSFTKRGWLYLEEAEHLLTKLLSLPLTRISQEDRKRIGPPSQEKGMDTRPIWHPPLMENGKKSKITTDAWKTLWPKDDTLLSSCEIKLYLPPQEISSFPLWMEATNGHFTYPIKAICVGKDMVSSLKTPLPRRPPQFLKGLQKQGSYLILPLRAPAYYKRFSLFVFDLLHPQIKIGPIPHTLEYTEKKESLLLKIPVHSLPHYLTRDHRYKWIAIPDHPEGLLAESEDFFLYTPPTDSVHLSYEQIHTEPK